MISHFLLLDGFLEYQKGRGISSRTITRNYYQIKKFLNWISDKDIRDTSRDTIFNYKRYLENQISSHTKKPLAKSTISCEISGLKTFFDYLQQSELILKNPLEDIKIRNGQVRKLRSVFLEEDMIIFLDNISISTSAGIRDRALFELMYSSGLRVNEILNLEMDHINLDERILLIKQGKGQKDRYVPFCKTALKFLILYIKRVRKDEKKKNQYLFKGRSASLNYGKLRIRFNKYLKDCSLDGKGYTMHSIRHGTATHLLSHGASIRYVQELLGHEDLKTTQLYTRPTEDNIRKVYRTYHPRENEYHREVSSEYLKQITHLKRRILWGKSRSEFYKKNGHTRGFGRFK